MLNRFIFENKITFDALSINTEYRFNLKKCLTKLNRILNFKVMHCFLHINNILIHRCKCFVFNREQLILIESAVGMGGKAAMPVKLLHL